MPRWLRRRLRAAANVPLRLAPSSDIAPLPKPCIANEKSARPSCSANRSRIRQTDRESISGAAPPYAAGTQ
jgi:hypothetical protein